jgi:type IX secretion system PorP/SprF family membrane protein
MRQVTFFLFVVTTLAVISGSGLKKAQAQQDPQFTHYMYNEMNYNPGYAGKNRRQICADFIQHSQYTSFNGIDGGSSPSTQFFNVNAPLGNKYVQGVGLSIYNDEVGFTNTVSAVASASHHLQTELGRLQLGFNAGVIQKTLNGDELDPVEADDSAIPNEEVSNLIFDAGLGAYLVAEKYYAGLSVLHLPEGDLGYKSEGNSKYSRSYYLTGGYNYQLDESWDLKPSTLVKFDGAEIQADLNGRAMLNDKYWGGLGYRVGEKSLNAMVGAFLTPKLKVGYSFDLSFQPNDIRSGGTHEILLGYCFNFNPQPKEEYPIWTPRFL